MAPPLVTAPVDYGLKSPEVKPHKKDAICDAVFCKTNSICGKPVVPGKTKCRGHGGLSTGPRTEGGLQRLAAAKTVHGRETRALRAVRSQISHELRQLEEILYAEGLIHGPRTRGRKPSLWRQFEP